MAKAALNSALSALSGRIDAWVYRETDNGLVVTKRPQNSTPPSPAQLAIREQFAAAAAYAKAVLADPVLGPRYTAAAKTAGLKPYPFALTDYLTPPTVHAIDTAEYHGAIGDVLKVHASDRFEVTGVTVVIRNAADAVLEQGVAVLTAGLWVYTATTAIAAGTAVKIQAIATDHPGHTSSDIVPLVVA